MMQCVICGNPPSYGDLCAHCAQREYDKEMERIREMEYADYLNYKYNCELEATAQYLIQFDDDGTAQS